MRIKPSTPSYHGGLQQMRTVPGVKSSLALCIALAFTAAAPIAQAAKASTPAVSLQRAAPHWQSVATPAASLTVGGATRKPALKLKRFHAATLDSNGMKGLTAGAPLERGLGEVPDTLTISLPHPDGGYQRFALVESPIMEAGLAAKHPDIKTYRGKGIDDPSATLRMDITKLGLHASVRSPNGGWYVDPYYHLDDSLYASYHGRDLTNQHGPLVEAALGEAQLTLSRGFYKDGDSLEVRGMNFAPGASVNVTVRADGDTAALQSAVATADSNGVVSLTLQARGTGAFEVVASDGRATTTASYHVVDAAAAASATVGNQLRTYRLALVTDPTYASYFGGSANVTAAKVTLINRVTQIYEDETSIRLVLIDGTDALNLDTAAQMTGANGPCGGAACYTPSQAEGCSSSTLSRNRIVTGLLVGASSFDIGHIGFGLDGGGIASLGVVGGSAKAQGCTGVPTPVGDVFAVDYVAHEIGHQFSGNHTFNGVNRSCAGGNRNPETSVEPGSGTSIMAYAGICGVSDNVQPHSDPYWSQRSFDEVVAYTSGAETAINEVQTAALRNFTTNGQQFRIRWNGNLSAPIVRGTNYTAAGIRTAIQAIAGWPAGATATASSVTNNGFNVTFGGTLAGTNVAQLELANFSSGVSGFTGEVAVGGLTRRGGTVSSSGNSAPLVTAPAGYTIPVRTPFALTGSATDADGDTVTYLWEQNDRGGSDGTALVSNAKTDGPLFSQFGKRAIVTSADTIKYESPGENHVTTDPTRVFPDIDQILANNTNAESGACPTPPATPTAANIDCYAEFLPTADYVGYRENATPPALNFRLTARDGLGGVSSADTRLVLAHGAGPFLVTSPNAATTLPAGSTQTVTWNVANTNAAPVGVDDVKISLSTDGGKTWPHTLAASTPNDGSASVTLPAVATTAARIKVEAIGNVFFDVSNVNFKIDLSGDVNADGVVDCTDLGVIRAAIGTRAGQAGFDARADVVADGVINVRDVTYVARLVPQGTSCN